MATVIGVIGIIGVLVLIGMGSGKERAKSQMVKDATAAHIDDLIFNPKFR